MREIRKTFVKQLRVGRIIYIEYLHDRRVTVLC